MHVSLNQVFAGLNLKSGRNRFLSAEIQPNAAVKTAYHDILPAVTQ